MLKNLLFVILLITALLFIFSAVHAGEKQYEMTIDGNKTTCFKQDGARVWFCWEHPKETPVTTPVKLPPKPSGGAIK